jgi:hypothetical protein
LAKSFANGGRLDGVIFAIGLVGASLLAAAVLPLATSYAVSEAFGFSKGVGLDFRRARLFFALGQIGGTLLVSPDTNLSPRELGPNETSWQAEKTFPSE